jgi:hypothetical protein
MINHSNENTILDDANSPEINKVLMGKVSSDFVKVCDHLKEASFQIRKRKFSDFPIFILHLNPIEMGTLLFNTEDFQTKYSYRASFFEEFVSRDMIGEESIELFKEYYKDPEEYCCLFVIENEFAGFIYLPFPID